MYFNFLILFVLVAAAQTHNSKYISINITMADHYLVYIFVHFLTMSTHLFYYPDANIVKNQDVVYDKNQSFP